MAVGHTSHSVFKVWVTFCPQQQVQDLYPRPILNHCELNNSSDLGPVVKGILNRNLFRGAVILRPLGTLPSLRSSEDSFIFIFLGRGLLNICNINKNHQTWRPHKSWYLRFSFFGFHMYMNLHIYCVSFSFLSKQSSSAKCSYFSCFFCSLHSITAYR